MTEATYFIITDMKVTETDIKPDKKHVLLESSKKSMYSNEEYDMISQTTETLDKSIENYPATQDCNSEYSNCLYVKEKLYPT